jgi:hypothetical protein
MRAQLPTRTRARALGRRTWAECFRWPTKLVRWLPNAAPPRAQRGRVQLESLSNCGRRGFASSWRRSPRHAHPARAALEAWRPSRRAAPTRRLPLRRAARRCRVLERCRRRGSCTALAGLRAHGERRCVSRDTQTYTAQARSLRGAGDAPRRGRTSFEPFNFIVMRLTRFCCCDAPRSDESVRKRGAVQNGATAAQGAAEQRRAPACSFGEATLRTPCAPNTATHRAWRQRRPSSAARSLDPRAPAPPSRPSSTALSATLATRCRNAGVRSCAARKGAQRVAVLQGESRAHSSPAETLRELVLAARRIQAVLARLWSSVRVSNCSAHLDAQRASASQHQTRLCGRPLLSRAAQGSPPAQGALSQSGQNCDASRQHSTRHLAAEMSERRLGARP